MKRLMVLTCGLLVSSLLIITAPGTPRANATCTYDCWNTISSPNQGSSDNVLYSVAAVGLSDVWTVGTYTKGGAGHFPLAEHWNGTSWSTSLPTDPYTEDNYL